MIIVHVRLFARLLLIAVCAFFAELRAQETYRWVDEKGTVNFTDNPQSIPEKYRGETEATKSLPSREPPAPRLKRQSEESRPAPQRQQIYGGQSVEWWRKQFRFNLGLKNKHEESLKRRQEEYRRRFGPPRVFEADLDRDAKKLATQIKTIERDLRRIEAKLNDLEIRASRAGVPRQFRE